jgi:putative redox protein
MATVTIRWVEGTLMVGTDSSGHSIVIGRNPDDPKTNIGMKASELLLISAAACSAYDVAEILAKQREPMQDLKVECSGEQMSEPPYRFTKIHLHYRVVGDVAEERLVRAICLSEEKYCSVLNTLRAGVELSSDYEIIK